jgi:hypothetical protein
LELGMNRMLFRDRRSPEAMQTSIVPIPTAWIELPPNPLTVRGGIALRVLKSPRSDEMWQFVPESRMKGIVPMREIGG